MQRIPHFVRKGRPGGKTLWYWQPSPALRKAGWGDKRLSDDPAIAEGQAQEINAEVARWRLAQARGEEGSDRLPGTVHHLVASYRAHDDFLLLADATRRRYMQCLEIIGERLGKARTKAITPPVVQAFKRTMARTPWQANHVLRTLRLLFSFGIREGYVVGPNPCTKFRGYRTPPRDAVWAHAEEARFLEAASDEMRLAYLLAVYSAQRQGDLLVLPWSSWDGEAISLRQNKTGRRLEIPAAGPLRLALEQAPRRSTIILTRPDGQPWKADHFRHVWAQTTAAAGVKGRRFMDLRRTAVVRLAEASCTIPEIASITGHDIDVCQRIVDTYLPRTRRLAARAILKLESPGRKRPAEKSETRSETVGNRRLSP